MTILGISKLPPQILLYLLRLRQLFFGLKVLQGDGLKLRLKFVESVHLMRLNQVKVLLNFGLVS